MEPDLRILPAERAMERILDLLGETESVPLVISGTSMEPFLTHHRDTVYLSRITVLPGRGTWCCTAGMGAAISSTGS